MLLQTNSYIVPKDKRAEHARLLARFRQSLAKHGCDHFEAYEQVGPNWGSTESTGRFVQIMRFRDRKHQQQVQAAERTDPAAQQLIKEFCDLINLPYQQQQGFFASGFYNSVLAVGPTRAVSPAEPPPPAPGDWGAPVQPPPVVPPIAEGIAIAAAVAASTPQPLPVEIEPEPPEFEPEMFAPEPPPMIVEPEPAPEALEPEFVAPAEPQNISPPVEIIEPEPIEPEPIASAPQPVEPEDALIEPPAIEPEAEAEVTITPEQSPEPEAFENLEGLPDDIQGSDIAPPSLSAESIEDDLPPPMMQDEEPVLDMPGSESLELVVDEDLEPPPLELRPEDEQQDDEFKLEVPQIEDEALPLDPEIEKH